MKKICIISPSLQMGGIERSTSILANYFAEKGYDVHFLTLFPFTPFFQLNAKVALYVPPFPFPRIGRSFIQTILYYFKILSPLNGYVKKNVRVIKPDVIISYGDWLPHAIMLQLKEYNIPFFYSNRSNPQIKYSVFLELIRETAYLFAPPTGIIAQTSDAKERKVRITKNKVPIQIIPNPVLEVESDFVERRNWIVSVGRLHHEKGFVRLMEAFKKIDAPDWRLVLAGSGIHEQEIKQKAREFNIVDRVDFLGKVHDIPALLNKSKIFVFPSHREGFPNALCEAMASGLPCISFDIIAGPKDIIENGVNGFLVPDGDIETLAEKMKLLIDNEELRYLLGIEAKKIVKKYSLEKIGQMFEEFILSTKIPQNDREC